MSFAGIFRRIPVRETMGIVCTDFKQLHSLRAQAGFSEFADSPAGTYQALKRDRMTVFWRNCYEGFEPALQVGHDTRLRVATGDEFLQKGGGHFWQIHR
jgi:hypothetical protein